MQLTLSLAAILPLLAPAAIAQAISCQTVLGATSVKNIPTTTITTTSKFTATQTLAKQSTVTASVGTTSTSTIFTTQTDTETLPTSTDVVTITTTSFEVESITNWVTTTTTTTQTDTTSSTSTTVYPTSTGFRPIWDTLNNNALARRKALLHPHAGLEARAATTGKAGVQKLLATQYPNKVQCTKVVSATSTKTVYTTVPKATTTITYQAKKIATYMTLTVTETVVPTIVTSIETDTFTSNVQTTTVSTETDEATSTTTYTSVLPGPTFWDACTNQRNVFGPGFQHSGVGYYAVNVANNGPGVASDFQIVSDGATSAEACCNACQRLGNCENYIFRSSFKNCFLLNHAGATCSAQNQHPNFILSKKIVNGYTADGYTVGNGNCGYAWSGNSDGSLYSVDGA